MPLFLVTIFVTLTSFLWPHYQKSHLHVYKNAEDLGKFAAQAFQKALIDASNNNKTFVVILPSHPLSSYFYRHLIDLWHVKQLDLSKTVTFSLTEPLNSSSMSFLHKNFYHLVSDELTHEKLSFFGLRLLSIEDLSDSLLKRFSLDQINQAINTFQKSLIEAFNTSNHLSYDECEKIYWKTLKYLKERDEIFAQLDSHILNDKILPTSSTLIAGIYHDMSLRVFGLKKENIYYPQPHSQDPLDIKTAVNSYEKNYFRFSHDPKSFTMFFLPLAEDLPSIGLNHFLSDLSDEEKQTQALKTSIRALPTETFYTSIFGFKEILEADDILILAQGLDQQAPLFETFSTPISIQVPGSLLRLAKKCDPCFYIDETAYGRNSFSQKNLRSFYQEKMKDNSTLVNIYFRNTNAKTLFDIPSLKEPVFTLNPCSETIEDAIDLVSLPQKKNILFVKKNKSTQFHLLELLKLKQNTIKEIPWKKVKDLKHSIIESHPDILFLPSDIRKNKQFILLLKTLLEKEKYTHPLLGIYYSLKRKTQDAVLPLSKESLSKKIESLKRFHLSLINSSSYPLIAHHLAYYYRFNYRHKKTPNENFELYQLTKNNERLFCHKLSRQVLTFTEDVFLPKGYQSFKLVSSDKIIAISPHPNDIEISMGGFIYEAYKNKIPIIAFNATTGHRAKLYKKDLKERNAFLPETFQTFSDGGKYHEITDDEYKTMIREFETMNALKFLNPLTTVENLRLPFYSKGLVTKKDKDLAFQALEKHLALEHNRILIFLPRQDDSHPTNQLTTELFYKTIKNFFKVYPQKKIYLAFYRTAWSGFWNLYHFNYHRGSPLAALVGVDMINRSQNYNVSTNNLGGPYAERFFVFPIIPLRSDNG